MEDKKLNFNRPFLSVRRILPAVTSQKDDKGKKTGNYVPLMRQLPPHRSELKSGPVQNPGAVPFRWEQTPGQPKEVSKLETQNYSEPPTAPRPPPGRCSQASQQDTHQATPNENMKQKGKVASESQSGLFHDENFKTFEGYEEMAEKRGHSESGDSDESYVDALDTLSRTESFFMDYSVSNLSELDDLDIKPAKSFLTDQKTHGFMMDRFLPAAKAMASETPQYASKKEPIIRAQPQQSKKLVKDSTKPLLRYGPSFAKRYTYYHEAEELEEESGDDCDQHKKIPGVCGLLPRFCFKSSLGVLNAVPAMSMRTRVPVSVANTLHTRSSSAGYLGEINNECNSDNCERKSRDHFGTSEVEVNITSSWNDQLKKRNTSTCCNASLSCIKVPVVLRNSEGTKYPGISIKTFRELLSDQGCDQESDSEGPAMEKTLYIDTMKIVETKSMTSCSSSTEDTNGVFGSEEEVQNSASKVYQMRLIDAPPEVIKKLAYENVPPDNHKFDGFNIVSLTGKLNPKGVMDVPKPYAENEEVNLNSAMAKNMEVTDKEAPESVDSRPPKTLTLRNGTNPSKSQLPVPPSLPNSPSDSWLGRTLPSISTKKLSLRSSLGAAANPQNLNSRVPPSHIKWETFVKSTKVQQLHSCHSKELLMPIPEV